MSQLPRFCLSTPRLHLRSFAETDLTALVAYRSDPEVARYQGWPRPYTAEMGQALIDEMMNKPLDVQGAWLQIAIEQKESGVLMGDCAFAVRDSRGQQAEIGYTLARPFHGQGYATEAITRLLQYLFDERGLHRVHASCDTQNAASIRLLERLGMRREAHFVENYWDDGQWTSEYLYAMLAREWKAKAA
ncbi:MAG: GNAT family N-acetyltransferase [Caldilineaceae bacterium]|nr:GNAT family N-acetyltransferase [Caldilineaceae bacterium]